MGRVEAVTVGISDRVTVSKFQSLGPMVEFRVSVDPGEDIEIVRQESFELAGDMWEKELCLRLWWRIDMHQRFGAPAPEPWAMKMYEHLYNKHYANTTNGQ